jgi:hypothetical protein
MAAGETVGGARQGKAEHGRAAFAGEAKERKKAWAEKREANPLAK